MRTPLRPLTRRGLLTGAFGSAALLAGGGSLAGCGTRAATRTEAGCVSEDLSGTEKTLTFSKWPQYMDVDDADTAKTIATRRSAPDALSYWRIASKSMPMSWRCSTRWIQQTPSSVCAAI